MDRQLLLLIENEISEEVSKVLKPLLELSFNLIKDFIENKLDNLKDKLDNIKSFTAGIQSAEIKGRDYTIARMYPYYFAFHQFFHSSFRARQGKVLEEVIKNVLSKENNISIFSKKQQRELFNTQQKNLPDYDIFFKVHNTIFIIQIRSRDDTGGTTAKTSLVEGVSYIIENYKADINNIEYIVLIWESLDNQQQSTTKEKFYDYLKESTDLDKQNFFKRLSSSQGVNFSFSRDNTNINLNLYLVYGKDEFINLLNSKLNLENNTNDEIKKNLKQIISTITDWDDIWMSYQYIALEYERLKEYDFSYIYYIMKYIMEYITKNNITIESYTSMKDYISFANEIANYIIRSDIDLPFKNGKDNFIYFRDLILLILVYLKKSKKYK